MYVYVYIHMYAIPVSLGSLLFSNFCLYHHFIKHVFDHTLRQLPAKCVYVSMYVHACVAMILWMYISCICACKYVCRLVACIKNVPLRACMNAFLCV